MAAEDEEASTGQEDEDKDESPAVSSFFVKPDSRVSERTTPINEVYGLRPRDPDEPVIEPMKVYVSEIDKVGKVTIKYDPPEAVVPDSW